MESDKEIGAGAKTTVENLIPDPPAAVEAESAPETAARSPSRTPFTSLDQVAADLALARALQEQERAYMMLRMNGGDGSDYASSESGSYVDDNEVNGADPDHHHLGDPVSAERSGYDEDAFDANYDALDPADFSSDEAYARALQDAEEREVAVRLMALAELNEWGDEDHGDLVGNSQDAWQEVDPDELSYEELVALSEVVGTESRGLSADTIAALPSVSYKTQTVGDDNTDQCVICRLDYEDGDAVIVLSCKHTYHSECINKWLQINKVCPICSAEVSTSSDSSRYD